VRGRRAAWAAAIERNATRTLRSRSSESLARQADGQVDDVVERLARWISARVPTKGQGQWQSSSASLVIGESRTVWGRPKATVNRQFLTDNLGFGVYPHPCIRTNPILHRNTTPNRRRVH
jgi:hypothetical protein